jgi:hypothetical protein
MNSNKALQLTANPLRGLSAAELGRYAFSKMKQLVPLVCIVFSVSTWATPIECLKHENNSVTVKMDIPHPKEALIYRPSGETVWLQNDGTLAHKQIKDFENLQEWKVDSDTIGTVYKNGKPYIEQALDSKGVYHLYIAENVETERENTYFIECHFEIT